MFPYIDRTSKLGNLALPRKPCKIGLNIFNLLGKLGRRFFGIFFFFMSSVTNCTPPRGCMFHSHGNQIFQTLGPLGLPSCKIQSLEISRGPRKLAQISGYQNRKGNSKCEKTKRMSGKFQHSICTVQFQFIITLKQSNK